MKFFLALLGLAAARHHHHHHAHHIPDLVQTGDVFYPFEKGMLGGGTYERVMPANYGGDADDIFMRSVIHNYALELKTDDDTSFELKSSTTSHAISSIPIYSTDESAPTHHFNLLIDDQQPAL